MFSTQTSFDKRGAQGRGFNSPRGRSLFAFNLGIMKKIDYCAHSVSVVYLINVKVAVYIVWMSLEI